MLIDMPTSLDGSNDALPLSDARLGVSPRASSPEATIRCDGRNIVRPLLSEARYSPAPVLPRLDENYDQPWCQLTPAAGCWEGARRTMIPVLIAWKVTPPPRDHPARNAATVTVLRYALRSALRSSVTPLRFGHSLPSLSLAPLTFPPAGGGLRPIRFGVGRGARRAAPANFRAVDR